MKKFILLHSILLFGGVLFGIAAYLCLPDGQTVQLQQYLTAKMQDSALVGTMTETTLRIFHANFMDLLRIYLAGICLLGVPLLALFLFVKGFTFGFSACFLLRHSLLLLLSRFCYMPLLIAAAAFGCRFSFMLLQNRASNPIRQLLQYTLCFAALLLLALLCSCIDGLSNCHYLRQFVG